MMCLFGTLFTNFPDFFLFSDTETLVCLAPSGCDYIKTAISTILTMSYTEMVADCICAGADLMIFLWLRVNLDLKTVHTQTGSQAGGQAKTHTSIKWAKFELCVRRRRVCEKVFTTL